MCLAAGRACVVLSAPVHVCTRVCEGFSLSHTFSTLPQTPYFAGGERDNSSSVHAMLPLLFGNLIASLPSWMLGPITSPCSPCTRGRRHPTSCSLQCNRASRRPCSRQAAAAAASDNLSSVQLMLPGVVRELDPPDGPHSPVPGPITSPCSPCTRRLPLFERLALSGEIELLAGLVAARQRRRRRA